MTDTIKEARALVEYWVGILGWPASSVAVKRVAALADECERLQAENARHVDFRASINEALPRPFGVTVLGAINELKAENARLLEALPTAEEREHVRMMRDEDKLNAECPDHIASIGVVDRWLARLDAAKGVR